MTPLTAPSTPRNTGTWLLVVLLALATGVMTVIGNGSIGAAAAPAIAMGLGYGLLRLPLRVTAALFFAVVLLFHNPGDNPMENHWRGPLTLLGPLIYNNLRHITGIGALRFCLIELALVAMLAVMAARTAVSDNVDRQRTRVAASALKWALLVSLGGTILMIVWGMARGGNAQQLLWQVRLFLWAPAIIAVSMRAFKTEADFRRLFILLLVVTCARSLEGAYFYYAYVRPQGLLLEYVITHDDTVIFVLSIVIMIAFLLEARSRRALLLFLLVAPLIVFGIYINSRRLAYVSLVFCLMPLYFMIRSSIRVWLTRVLLWSSPLLALYVVVGLSSNAAIFKPVHNLLSVTDTQDASNLTRDIENFNLVATLRNNPIVGSGFGHEYDEVMVAYSIAEFMPNYRYIAHNSILWLFSLTGAVGVTLIWVFIPVGVFLAAFAYRRTHTAMQRATAMGVVAAAIIYLVQCFGDMGAVSWMATIVLSIAIGCSGNLVMRTAEETEGAEGAEEIEAGEPAPEEPAEPQLVIEA